MGRRKANKKRKRRFLSDVGKPFRRTLPPGSSPGVPDIQPDAVPPKMTYIHYGPEYFKEGALDNWEILNQLQSSPYIKWVNVEGLGSLDVVNRIGGAFQLHPLALEDVVHVHQRAKVEEYSSHLFIVARMASLDEHLETEQISIFLGKDYVITFQEGPPRRLFGARAQPAEVGLRRHAQPGSRLPGLHTD
jgi:magnesium transporter